MFNTGTKKVIRDLLQEKRRTLTVMLAMVIGVFAVAMMSSSKSLLDKNLTENFQRTNPASFSLFVKNANDSLLTQIENNAAINQVTTRQSIWIRMKKPDGAFLPVLLYVVNDVQNPVISTYNLDEGKYPNSKNEIIIERTGKKLEPLQTGQSLELHFPGFAEANYTLSGFTHDAGIAPSWMEGYLYGYVSSNTLPDEYLARFPTEIKCTVAEDQFNRKHIEAVAKQTQAQLENAGISVITTEIHEPGVHMHQKQMNALMFLILNFGILALVLSCFLIINMISAIMAKEIRQIAIMKSTGASTLQITRIYITTILIMAIASIAIGTPLGLLAGKAFSTFNASMLNFELFDVSTEPFVLLIIVLTGICLPLIMSVFPILNSSRVSVQKALNDTGVESGQGHGNFITKTSRFFSGSFILALKNAFRRKTRLALTVISLSVGGAIFITAFNIRQSTSISIDDVFDNQPQDIMYVLTEPCGEDQIAHIISNEKVNYELGFRSQGSFVYEQGQNSNTFNVTAIDENSQLITPAILDGRWIEKGKHELVLNQLLQTENPDLQIGGKVTLSINLRTQEYTIVGVCKEMFTPAGLFMAKDEFAEQLNLSPGSGSLLLIDALTEDQNNIAAINSSIEKALKASNINIVSSITKADYKKAVVEHLLIIMAMLLSMTLLVVVVGGMGMATSININVSERIRELGILRAIGMLKKDIRLMVMTEAITMGALSWLLAIVLSVPLSAFLGNQFFSIFFESSMNVSISSTGIAAWLILALVIGTVSSVAPANRIIKRQITEVLSYE